ncbi:PAS domain S-box protein [Nitrospirota bacterium]
MAAFVIAFLLIAGVLSGLVIYVIISFETTLNALYDDFANDMKHDKLLLDLDSVAQSARVYADTGKNSHMDQYEDEKSELKRSLMNANLVGLDPDSLEELRALSEVFISAADIVASYGQGGGGPEMLHDVDMLLSSKEVIHKRLMAIHFDSMSTIAANLRVGHSARVATAFYIYGFIGFCLLSCAFLFMYMRKIVEEPTDIILEATGMVSSGDLGYRIESARNDEFGLIFRRFNHMVESLEMSRQTVESRLNIMQLILAIGTLSSEGRSLGDVLSRISSLVSEMLSRDIFAVFVRDRETKSYSLSAFLKSPETMQEAMRFVEDASLARRVTDEREPFVLRPGEEGDLSGGIMANECLIVAPCLHEDEVLGFVLIGSGLGGECGSEEIDTARVIASTVGVMIRNHTLHEETTARLSQLSMVFELAKEITSLYEPKELLNTIAQGVAGLIHSRGCIIRIFEDEMLVPKAIAGMDMESFPYAPLPVDRGVPGWVMTHGEPMIVDDVASLSKDMSYQLTARKTALVVPMIKEDVIIGTLGIVDKMDEEGEIIQFSVSDRELAEGFASISALAIDKAMVHEHGTLVEAEMEKAEKRMSMLFDNVQVGIITLDENYSIKSANKYIERWADMKVDDMLMKDAREVFHREGDESFICPHCAAKSTFEEGGVYSVNMSKGLNYAELASYPLKDNEGKIREAIVVIQDTTARVLYEEDIMGLYREVMQANEYIESLIRNSADAIVTTDLDGKVQSWNPAAEEIYGFRSNEVTGMFLPYVLDGAGQSEHEYIERIRKGEVLNLETFRKRSDGAIIEVSQALSPIKDISGEIIGISHISRDITDKKRVEKELIRRNQELSRLFFISSTMRGTLDLDRVLHMVLVTVTMSDGLGFNRAVLFLLDEENQTLRSELGVGPSSHEEASKIWNELSRESRGLRKIMKEIEEGPLERVSLLDKLGVSIEVQLSADSALAISAREQRVLNINGDEGAVPVDAEIRQKLDSDVYACVPLVSMGNIIGVLWVDNKFNQKEISDEDMKFLAGFADQVASAIESARLFTKVSLAEAELENIFSSISDMVYFTDRDYTVRNVNQAVLDRLGLEKDAVVGRKCYQVFHGKDDPLPSCPHHSTVETLTPFVREVEDKYLKGTFIASTAPMFSPERDFLGTVHVVRDISEIRDLREKLQSAERKAALGEVAAKVAHEIRNPLVSVGGFARRLEGKLDGTLKEYASIISTEAVRLEAILKDILSFVREVRMQKKVVDLNDILSGVLGLMDDEFKRAGNELVTKLDEEGVILYVDPDRIREAVMNIIVNANQAVERGTITISTLHENHMGVLEVSDTGPGVNENIRETIFDPFFTTRTTGTGLGLAVTKRIVEEHEGSIEVLERSFGSGVIFRVYLPIEEGEHENTGS